MVNSIKQIIREYKSKSLLEDIKSLKIKSKSDKDEIIIASNTILNIMNKVEQEVIKKYKPTINHLKLYSIDTEVVNPGVSSGKVLNIGIKNDLIKIRSVHRYCGGESYSIVKIPLSYYDMYEDEIKITHTNWCEEHFTTGINKAKINLTNKKIKEIAKLKEEIKELSK